MIEYGSETILVAVIVSSIAFIIIAVILGFMFKYVKQLVDQKSVDNSLQNELSKEKEDNELKEKTIENLNDKMSILIVENLDLADQRNDLAILLKQKE